MSYPVDITRVDVDIAYGQDSADPDNVVNPLVEAFVTREADNTKDEIVIAYHGNPFLARFAQYSEVKYVVLHHLSPITAPNLPVDVLWVDSVSGDSGSTQILNAETMIIPSVKIWDEGLGIGGVTLFTASDPASLRLTVVGVHS